MPRIKLLCSYIQGKQSNVVDGGIPIGVERVRVVVEPSLYQSSFGPLFHPHVCCTRKHHQTESRPWNTCSSVNDIHA